MGESIASKILPIINAPESTDFKTTFVYFGYNIDSQLAGRADTTQITVSWTGAANTTEFGDIGGPVPVLSAEALDDTDWKNLVISHLNAGSVFVLDESIMGHNFSNIILQDYYAEIRSVELLDAALAGINVNIENLNATDGTGAIITALGVNTDLMGTTENNIVGESVSDEILTAILNQKIINNALEPTGVSPGNTLLGMISGIQHINTIDTGVVHDVARLASKNPYGAFSGNISYVIDDLANKQMTAINLFDPNMISSDSFEYGVVPIGMKDANVDKYGEAIVVGYLLEKSELTLTGDIKDTIIKFVSQDPNENIFSRLTFNWIDEDIDISTTYTYTISTIAVARIPSLQTDNGIKDIDVLVRSRPQTSIITTGTGYPPPPSGIEFIYDNFNKRLHIGWDFGTDDINATKFQVFRRKTIDEPFSLIRQYDFGISINPYVTENIDYGLNVKLDQALFYYIDEDFVEGKEYIYALCSINENGASSSFSDQYTVNYNIITGELEIRLLSVSGAPKPYPNFYLDQELTQNVGKISDVSKLKLYFTPEVYNVTKNSFDLVTGDISDTVLLDFLKESGSLTKTGKYSLEMTELGTFQQTTTDVILSSDDILIQGSGRDQGLILDPTSV